MGEKYNKDSQISFMCKNNPGELQSVCNTLNEASINIRAISMTDASDHAVIRMITNDAMKTRIVLDHMGFNTILSPVLIFEVSDYPGACAGCDDSSHLFGGQELRRQGRNSGG